MNEEFFKRFPGSKFNYGYNHALHLQKICQNPFTTFCVILWTVAEAER